MTRRFDTDEATLVREPGVDAVAGVLPNLDDEPGPARRLSTARSARMVTDILDAALLPAIDAPPSAAPAPRRMRWVPVLAAALVAAAVVGAAAAVITTKLLAAPPAQLPVTPPSPAVAPPIAPIAIAPAPPPIAPAPVAPSPPQPPSPRAAVDDEPAADLLARASQHRKAHAWREADELYRRVASRFARTDAGVVARIASATLHLEHFDDARGALQGYRRALLEQPRGDLDEEARWGIAEAQRALGDREGEQLALHGFLRAHPASALAPAARRRLAALSSTP